MNNNVPNFTAQEWGLMRDYIENSSKQPRQNLIELISNVDLDVAQLGMNSGPYFMLDRLLTDEQVKTETARCLRCGAAHVDESQCIGCGVCTTRCKFDAITLYKKYNEVPVPNEELKKDVGREVMRRIDAAYAGKPLVNKVMKLVVKQKVKPKKLKEAKPRKW